MEMRSPRQDSPNAHYAFSANVVQKLHIFMADDV